MKRLPRVSIVVALLAAIFLIKLYLVHPSFSDENIYYAMGKIVSEGQQPYLDFNFVHPPIHLYLLATAFKIFGTSLTAAKLLPLLASAFVIVLIYLISRKIFDGQSAFVSAILFILTPAFLAFSDQGYGIWESLFFIWLSLYLALKQKYELSALSFSVAIFIRYLSVLFFPLLLLVLYQQKLKWKKFAIISATISAIFFAIFYSLYGFNFIDQTVYFQIFAKTNLSILPKLPLQYLGFGFFSVFLALISLAIGVSKKDKLTILFSAYPLFIDALIFSGFTVIIYHYFLISLSFIMLAVGRAFTLAGDKLVKIGIIGIVIISIYHNYSTIDYYQNPVYANRFYEIANYVAANATTSDKIFGESSITSFITVTKNISISSSYLDSFLSYLIYKDERSVVANLEREEPKFIIDMNGYYESNAIFSRYLSEKYQRTMEFPGTPTYILYERKG